MEEEVIEADADGSICSIHVVNFFCHENLRVDLNKNVNFIVGRNGSGKSAILTALVVGLGGRAASTNRGNNLQSFIKKGANSATIEIKIKNSSGLAYKHHIYGDYITISRHINASGGSSYKVKNTSGEVISTKSEEVTNIITAHDIQVENPISVLNQDNAQAFHATDAKKKFQLFRKATNMDRTEQNYDVTLEDCKKATNTRARKCEALQVLKKEYDKLKAIHARLQSHSVIEAQEKALENEYYWSEIVELEREVDIIKEKYNKQTGKIDKLVEKLSKMEENYGNNNGAIEALKAQLEQSTRQRSVLEQEYNELESQLRQAQATLRGLTNTNSKHRDLLKREMRKVVDLEREIESIDSDDVASQRAALEAAAEAAAGAAAAARARYDTAQHGAAQARQHAAHCAAARDSAARPLQQARQRLRNYHLLPYDTAQHGAAQARQHAAHCAAARDSAARPLQQARQRLRNYHLLPYDTAQHGAAQARQHAAHCAAARDSAARPLQQARQRLRNYHLLPYDTAQHGAAQARQHAAHCAAARDSAARPLQQARQRLRNYHLLPYDTAQHGAAQARQHAAHCAAARDSAARPLQQARQRLRNYHLLPYDTAQHGAAQARQHAAHCAAARDSAARPLQQARQRLRNYHLLPYDTAQHGAAQARQHAAHCAAARDSAARPLQQARQRLRNYHLLPYDTAQHGAAQARQHAAHCAAARDSAARPLQQARQRLRNYHLLPYDTAQHGAAQARQHAAHCAAARDSAARPLQQARQRLRNYHLLPYDTAQHGAAQARQHAAHCAAARDSAARPLQQARQRLRDLKQQLQDLATRGNDSVAVYGANMVALCAAVKQATQRGQFSEMPRGPVGSYLKVREKRWGGALEHVLGGAMQAFCVNTDQDLRTLFDIMGKVFGKAPKPSVTCSRFLPRRHDVSAKRVRVGQHGSALDALVVDDPVVANYLIDSLHVESILMVPEHAEAQGLSDRLENVPENCRKIVTLDTTEYHPAPAYRSYGGAPRASRFLNISTAERKRQLLAEIAEAEAQLRNMEAEEEKMSREFKQAKEAERTAARSLQALLGDRHAKEEAERQASAALVMQHQPHHAVLEEELNVSKEKVATLTQHVEAAAEKEREQKEKIDDLDGRVKETRAQLATLSNTCGNLDEEIQQEQLKLEQGVTERHTYKQRVKEERAKLAHIQAALDERNIIIHTKIAEAETLCPRVKNPRDKETVKREIEQAKSKLSSIRSEGRSKAEVEEELLRIEPMYKTTKGNLDTLNSIISKLENSATTHRYKAERCQSEMARLVQHYFNAMLTVNGYRGHMEIDFARGALEIQCTGRESSRLASTTASLSGGERSYSTVAFIMALWACVEVPFYFLDEFDVFMDNVNRRKVMEALLAHAEASPARQFVFLTPQDASSVKAGPHIKIHVMEAPRP